VQDPDVILGDEPISSVDPALALSIVNLLRDLSTETGKTLLMNLHSVDLALNYFPRVVGIRDGRVHFDLSPDKVDAEALEDLYAGDRTRGREFEDAAKRGAAIARGCRPLTLAQ
jgi:phosphonate transport system ATP-binding protein